MVETAVPLGSRQAINVGEKERGRDSGQTGAQREEKTMTRQREQPCGNVGTQAHVWLALPIKVIQKCVLDFSEIFSHFFFYF